MVDERMLQRIKEILKKVDTIKGQDNIGEKLAEYGVDISTLDDKGITTAIVEYMLTNEERMYYNRYTLYVRPKGLMEVSNIITSLNELTLNVDQLYGERKEAATKIFHINDIVKKIKMQMHDVPVIRISTLYNHLENDYHRYSRASIKAGMDESRMSDTIYNIEHGSFILRQIKTRELDRLKKELASYKTKASLEIDEKHEKYIRTREEYTELLRTVIMELLRNDLFLNAALLSINDLYGCTFQTEQDYSGVERITQENLKEVSRLMVVDKFFLYFDEHNQDKYDANTFYNLLEEFILYAYNNSIRKLEGKKSQCLAAIGEAFSKQKEMMGSLVQCQAEIDNNETFTEDEHDTLSLVYKTANK